MKCDFNGVADIIPVDIPVNMLVTVAWYTAVTKPNKTLIYHSTTGSVNPFTWGEMGKAVELLYIDFDAPTLGRGHIDLALSINLGIHVLWTHFYFCLVVQSL